MSRRNTKIPRMASTKMKPQVLLLKTHYPRRAEVKIEKSTWTRIDLGILFDGVQLDITRREFHICMSYFVYMYFIAEPHTLENVVSI